ncbi:hypothetical protein EDB89DRAFT_2066955 [Lactarius sanguifluus]|nr:hypothetical protein EDB89DRAFT_2066955 [Lactarius sanguifluus]
MLVAFLVAAFAILCIRVPSVWFALMATDEPSDGRELSLVVASRAHTRAPYPGVTPQATLSVKAAPPHAWPKLIMMRHKLNQANTRRRRTSATAPRSAPRSAPRQFALPAPRPARCPVDAYAQTFRVAAPLADPSDPWSSTL